MTEFSVSPETTQAAIVAALGDKVKRISIDLGEVKVWSLLRTTMRLL